MPATSNNDVALATPAVSAPTRARKRRAGPIIALANLGVAMAFAAIVIAAHGVDFETFAEVIRYTTRVAFLLFITTMIARPLHEVVGNSVTAWMLANRRYLGLSYAAWHLMHWPMFAGMIAVVGPATFWEIFREDAAFAGSILLVITLLAATSSNRAQRFLGKRLWAAIHTAGIYVIWYGFVKIYFGKLPQPEHPHVYVYLGLLAGALALRLVVAGRRIVKRLVTWKT